MTLRFPSLRTLLLLGLCAWLSLLLGRPAAQGRGAVQAKAPIAHFSDIAAKAGLAAPVVFGGEKTKKYIIETTGTGVAIFDYDNDGWPDIFIVNGAKLEGFAPGQPPTNHLYHNNHDGTFTDVTEKAGLAHTGWGQGVCVGDYDNDGFADLYVTYYGKNILYHNNGNGTFADVSEKADVAGNGKTWGTGCAFVDYDRDGKLDLMVANYVDYDAATALAPGERPSCMWKGVPVMCGPRGLPWSKNIFYHNNGDGTFDDKTFPAGFGLNTQYLGWGTMFLDVDNDGWPDLLLANGHVYPEVDTQHLGSSFREPKILYHNNGNGTLADLSAGAGPGITAESSSRGLAVGDLWNDGRMSAVISNMNAPPMLLVNDARNGNHWIALKTVGMSFSSSASQKYKSNRDGIGAKISAKVGGRILVDEVRSGSSYISNGDMRVHVGLGAASRVDWVEVRWPSGFVERFENLPVDSTHLLREGSGIPVNAAAHKP